jgi:hypothetical protein
MMYELLNECNISDGAVEHFEKIKQLIKECPITINPMRCVCSTNQPGPLTVDDAQQLEAKMKKHFHL